MHSPPDYYMGIEKEFQWLKKELETDDVATAILVLASRLHDHGRVLVDFDHQICMGLRHGLFGSDANDSVSIKDQAE